ncbi:kinase-like domain-containing protein [Helicostylum pulchrum]|nr:kinase-like domain-containing protein [Helicostylum pulchrum]
MSQFINRNNTEKPKTSPLSCIDNYEFHRSLGKGSMGKVKLGVHIITGEKVAVKIVRRANFQINGFGNNGRPKTKEQMVKEKVKEETRELRTIREAHIMMLLRHPHIVQLKNLVAIGPYFYILMDYVNGGQLLHYIVKRRKLSETHARHFSRQIVSALDYMHRNSIVHRDLKIENILIDKSGKNIKIIDFGLSNLFCPERRLTTYCGSLYFAAPELLRATPYRGPEIDVWSLGVVIYVMVTGSVPFDDKSMPGLHDKIKRGQVAYPSHLSPECKDLLSRIFVTDPTKRIKLADVIRHHWTNQGYKKTIKSYLPLRLPIAPPLAPHILQHMTRGFNMGKAQDIRVKMEMIIKSCVYRSAAEYVAKLQHTLHDDHYGKYDDPQTLPAAYHPLLSIYHLTKERLSHQEIEQESDSPIDHIKSASPPLTPIRCSSGYPQSEIESYPQEEVDDDNKEEEILSFSSLRETFNTPPPPLSPNLKPLHLTCSTQTHCPAQDFSSLEPTKFTEPNKKPNLITDVIHRSTNSLAAIFAKVLCTH